MTDENDHIEIPEEDTKEEDFSEDELNDTSIDWKAKAAELKGIAKRRATQLKKAKLAADAAKKVAKAGDNAPSAQRTPVQSTDGLDENALDFLDLKGVTESEDIKIVEDIVKKTGMTVRQALKDEYVVTKLAANKAGREVKEATPSNNRRSGSGSGDNDFARALAEYKASGLTKLPDDFSLRTKVINAMVAETNPNKPAWK